MERLNWLDYFQKIFDSSKNTNTTLNQRPRKMASPSENAATTRKHVEPLLMVALTLSFLSCVAAFISQFLLPSSDLTCSSRNVVWYGLALVLLWGLFMAEEEEGNYIIIFTKFSFAKSQTHTFSVL